MHFPAKELDYKPAAVKKENAVCQFLLQFGKLLHLSWQDRKNLSQMWSDFYALRPVSCFSDQDFMIWTLAILDNYMKITKTYLMDVAPYAEQVHIDSNRVETVRFAIYQ